MEILFLSFYDYLIYLVNYVFFFVCFFLLFMLLMFIFFFHSLDLYIFSSFFNTWVLSIRFDSVLIKSTFVRIEWFLRIFGSWEFLCRDSILEFILRSFFGLGCFCKIDLWFWVFRSEWNLQLRIKSGSSLIFIRHFSEFYFQIVVGSYLLAEVVSMMTLINFISGDLIRLFLY